MVAISRVAMHIPDTGLLEEPIRPTMRAETVAKKKPNTRMIKAPTGLTGMLGNSQMNTAITRQAVRTTFMEISCSVRRVLFAPFP